jgi:hypothetical protein
MIPENKTAATASDQNRAKLQKWSESSDYKSISFWIPPNRQISTEECIADVANALEKFELDRREGRLTPIG